MRSRCKRARGWKPIARQACARPCPTTRSSGAVAAPSSRTRIRSSGSSVWRRAAGPCRVGPENTAAAGSRPTRRAFSTRRCVGSIAARRCRASASGCSPPCCSNSAPRSRSRRICRRSRAARSAGARATASPRPAPTSPASRPAPCRRASISSSTATRCGPPTPTSPTGSSAWCAPIRWRRSMRASASSSSTWPIPACARGPSASSAAPRPSARPSSRMSACPWVIWLAVSIRAGRSPSACSSTSAR